ncbi:hypothetical protein DSM112329_04394 [Paraconexibacter sp. AEG42_29]|uniref:Uncharacterized protein n=1 Tax=Paraconexibacter sp. AEG42_29 TaxID=2997339 RepID=A0AAU7B0I6_9ACTN
MDLERTLFELREVEGRLVHQAQPVRERMASLGPSGLYALAATEQRRADITRDPDARMVYLAAAAAAEALGDLAAGVASRR